MPDDYAQLQRKKQKTRSILQALLLHLVLIVVVLLALRQSKSSEADAAGAVSVALVSAAETQPEPKPVHKAPVPQREVIRAEHADIDTAHKQQPKRKPSPLPSPQPSPKPSPAPTLKPSPRPSPAPTLKPSPKPKQELTQEKKPAPKAAAKEPADGAALEAERKRALNRLMQQAGSSTGSGSARSGSGSGSSYTPSESYKGRIAALLRRHTRFDPDTVEGNPIATIEIRMSADGTILGRPRLVRSSGNAAWDDAAVRGAIATAVIPRDPSLGRAPESLIYEAGPKD